MFKLVDICLNWILITKNLRLPYTSVSHHSSYDIFQLEKIIFRQGGKINNIKISTFCLKEIKKVEIKNFRSLQVLLYKQNTVTCNFTFVPSTSTILFYKKRKTELIFKYTHIETCKCIEWSKIPNANIQLGLNAGKTVPFWKFNSSSNLIIDPYCRNKRAGQESSILEPHKHTCFAHTGISKQHNLREKLTSLKMGVSFIIQADDKHTRLDIKLLLK